LNAIQQAEITALTRSQWYTELAGQVSGDSRTTIAECLRSRLYSRISVVRLIANNLIILGLIGTVIGFIISLGGIDAERVADVASVAPMVSTLIQGMSVALYTTLVGSVLHVWLMMCYQLLATGTVNLVNAIIEGSETTTAPVQQDII
jgi:biopolymer transport protein ExbB/TolQ